MYLPESFTSRIKEQLQEEYDSYLECLNQGMYHGIRINTNKISVEDFFENFSICVKACSMDEKWLLLR